MSATVYRLDPLGDVILTLRDPEKMPKERKWLMLPSVCTFTQAVHDEVGGLCDPSEVGWKAAAQVYASSRHLALASRTFSAMLCGDFSECQQLRAKSEVQVDLRHDDPDSLDHPSAYYASALSRCADGSGS